MLAFLSVFSCKKAQSDSENLITSKEIIVNKEWNGDSIISNLNFINTINSSCKLNGTYFERSEKQVVKDYAKCALSKIMFDYSKLDSIKSDVLIGKQASFAIFIKKTIPLNKGEADLYSQTTLYVKNEKSVSDSLIIHQSLNFSEALTVLTRYYYIDHDKIYLLDIAEDESGSSVKKWEEYRINFKTGKIKLIKEKKFVDEVNPSTISQSDDNYWKGVYYFEATNRDDAKTIFDITINSLEDILVKINDDDAKETYLNIKAEKINPDKIKIKYDSSENEMGIIYIEKSGYNYFISGNPIYFINPGTNEGELVKKKLPN